MWWEFLKSSIGRKYIMGLSGVVWAGFVFGHMAGNMLIFIGPDQYNAYGHALTSGMIIYVVEAVLITALVAHVICAVSLVIKNRAARTSRYSQSIGGEKGASLTSRTMAAQGSLILAFIILHIITFKYGTYYETTVNGVVMRDLARLMMEVFVQPVYLIWYFVSLVILGFHLRHGISSIFQSFGLTSSYQSQLARKLGIVYAVVVALGFLSQPIYVYMIAN